MFLKLRHYLSEKFQVHSKIQGKVQKVPIWLLAPIHAQPPPLSTFPAPQSRTFVITDEPALTRHNHPQVHSLHYSLSLVLYRLGQMNNGICPSYDIIRSIFIHEKSWMPLPFITYPHFREIWQPLHFLLSPYSAFSLMSHSWNCTVYSLFGLAAFT